MLLIVLFKPLLLLFKCLLEQDILLTILVHVLKQVDSGLVLTTPLLFTGIPLLLILFLGKSVDIALVSSLVVLHLVVVLLELLDLSSTSESLFIFNLLDGLLLLQSIVQ